jgi:tetratricopeptide (TPR) repeat protein
VIGLVQAGGQAIADRFIYVPSFGLVVIVVWGAAALMQRWKVRAGVAFAAGVAVVLAFASAAALQLCWWQNSITLMTRTLAKTQDNSVAHTDLGSALLDYGCYREAEPHLVAAARLVPYWAPFHYNIGWLRTRQHRFAEAVPHYRRALELQPEFALAHANLGQALLAVGAPGEAVEHLGRACEMAPNNASVRRGYGLALMRQGRLPEAAAELTEAVRLNSSDFVGYWHLSEVRRLQGNYPDAIASCREALRVNPNSHEALNNMAWLLATAPYADFRNGPDAVRYAEAACQQSENQVPLYIGTLAAALAEAGRFSDATQAARRAIAAAEDAGQL